MLKHINVLDKLWDKISSIDGGLYPKLKEWQINYFIEHKNRYLKDLALIEKIYKNGTIAEIGSLPCQLTFCLKELGYPIVGIDISPERAKSFIEDSKLETKKCDIEKEPLPFKNDTINLIIFNETFEHLRINPMYTLKELQRILSPQGRMILTTPNLYSLKNIIYFNLGKSFNDAYEEFNKLDSVGHMGHIREYTFHEMKKFLESAGFKIESHSYEIYQPSRKMIVGKMIDFMHKLMRKKRPFHVFVVKKVLKIKSEIEVE